MSAICHLCGAAAVREYAAFRNLRRVTSDCQPWPAGGALGYCDSCGATQKLVGAGWRAEVKRIYEEYAIYHQGAGAEQAVFDQALGTAQARSDRLVARLGEAVAFPQHGRALDIGCGNGAFLRAFAKLQPQWTLTGTEMTDRNRAAVETIQQLQRFHVGDFDTLDGTFDLVSLIHVLEHVESPVTFLGRLRARIAEGGRLFIEVPFYHDNPFDLLIADHATHFTPAVLSCVLQAAGFTVDTMAIDWVAKEISAVAHAGGMAVPLCTGSDDGYERLCACVRWLEGIANNARAVASGGAFGIFGTSIAGVWLYGEVEGKVDFFLDEDANRIGATLFERPILRPQDRPQANLFIALAPAVAREVAGRLAADGRGGAVLSPAPLN
jgi:2-polyprenyl-3-methyl-5-hydroxy-6-metoxy-1,4-benzoquinol methylase